MEGCMKTLFMVLAVFICGFVMFITAIPDKQTHWGTKNCELAEISPDFTPQEKADCRIMRSKK
jgi:hypothetical protein